MKTHIKEYSPQQVEKKWVENWDQDQVYRFEDNGNPLKMYILDMFPYPSGAGLHVGHLKGYLATDILTRFLTMKGYLVFHPMGWDAFGLPAEQYAIKTGNSPAEFTQKNISSFRDQLKKLMLTYDFSREIDTSSPEYYKHTQWIFSKMYEKRLAELVNTQVNWCPELNTVLSDEEIIEKENCLYSERGNHPVERKTMKQWVLKITKYAPRLLRDIDDLTWPENIKKIQKEWIGKSSKYEYSMKFKNNIYPLRLKYASSIRRLKGIGIHQFSRLSREMSIDHKNTGNQELIKSIEFLNMVDGSKAKAYYLKDIDFRSDELIPLFEGAEDDFYDPEIEEYYLRKDKVPNKKEIYKLKDWVFSRQRFWGEPIPILFNKQGKTILDDELPVTLPSTVNYSIHRNGKSPLSNNMQWLKVSKDGEEYERETNTMPNWAGSSWYFLAYLLKKQDGTYYDLNSSEAKEILNRWVPVDIYVGGQEHAAMHLLYARFWHKFLNDLGIVKCQEPFKNLFNQGMVLGSDGTKMSKSKNNYVSIDEIVNKYGADSLRLYEAFSGPTQMSFKWEDAGIKGSHKWLHKVYIFFSSLEQLNLAENDDPEISEIENRMIKNVESAIPSLKINLGVSEMMIFLNEIQKLKKYSYKSLESFTQILSLYAPALAEEIWQNHLNKEGYLFKSKWPSKNEIKSPQETEFKVFLKGKFKFMIKMTEDLTNSNQDLENYIFSQLRIKSKGHSVTIMQDRKVILVEPRSRK